MDLTPLCAGSMNLLLLHAQFSPGVKIDGRSKLYIYYALECAYGPLKMAARLCQPPLLTDNNLQSCLLHYITAASIWNSNCTLDRVSLWNLHNWGKPLLKLYVQVNNYEIVINFFHISHNLTRYSAIVHKLTRIYPVCSTYELTKQFM